jgi:hypothetical protein
MAAIILEDAVDTAYSYGLNMHQNLQVADSS